MNNNNGIWLAALGGVAVGALLATFFNSERGKQLVDDASSTVRDFTSQATEYAKNNIPGLKNKQQQPMEQEQSV
jgi:gas vesicle protein